jgi:ubiquinone/menaquinone biosynthesis C-methylase UbiE
MSDVIRTEMRRTWESAAPGWAKWETVFAPGLADLTETMLDMAGIGTGMRVLDLACGAGSQTLQAAERVGPKGRVVATDISATMLTHVGKRPSAKVSPISKSSKAQRRISLRPWASLMRRSADLA